MTFGFNVLNVDVFHRSTADKTGDGKSRFSTANYRAARETWITVRVDPKRLVAA